MLGTVIALAGGVPLPADDLVEATFKGNPYRQENRAAVAEVRVGKRTTAFAAWWGFDEADATRCLQAAIDSGAGKVVVSNMGRDWIITPITLAAKQEIFLEPGVVITAKRGAFKGSHDSLFKAQSKSNITVNNALGVDTDFGEQAIDVKLRINR